jgi:putative transposase
MTYWRVFYHLVWATKNREPLIADEGEAIIRRSFQLTSDDLGLIVHAVGVMPEHVHVALSIPPKIAVAEAVKRLKGASSFAVGRDQPHISFGWQDGYGLHSFSERGLPGVCNYVLNQADHHAQGTTIRAMERIDDD